MKSWLLLRNFLVVSLFLSAVVFAQDPVGGPYTVDANTLILLHFDDNLNNESDAAADAENQGVITYLPSPLGAGMGKCVRLKNDALSDSTAIFVTDSDALDLTGDWTIEGWMNVFTFGDASGDHRWVPRLCIKPGDEIFWRPNWWVELWGDNRNFQTGFHTSDQNNWPAVNSPFNIMSPGQWVHLTFIRDDTRKILIQMVHNANRELLSFGTFSYANLPVQEPLTNSMPVYIGWAGPGSADSWLDGFVDEIRVSNCVRNFAVPPIINNVIDLPNQKDDVPGYQVSADIMAFSQTGTITNAELRYTTDGGATWSVVNMVPSEPYTGVIPQVPFGSTVEYYVWAKDNLNQEARFPQVENGNLSFAVYKDYMMTLHLDFEEGTGAPIDKSAFNCVVTSPRPFNYSTDAKAGTYSYFMASDVDNKDSSFLDVSSPFLTSPNFKVDLWVKFDSLKQYVRVINRPLGLNNWWQNNYAIRTQDVPKLNAQYFVDPLAPNRIGDYFEMITTNTVEVNNWYHLIFTRDSTLAKFEVRDANDVLIEEVVNDSTVYDNPPLAADWALRIGNGGNVAGTRGLEGRVDEVKIYNNSEGINSTGIDDEEVRPVEFSLEQNFPNPFNPTTKIQFAIPRAEKVMVAVYDMMGRKVKTLVNENLYVGHHETSWDGTNDMGFKVSSGIYFYRLFTESMSLSRKMILLK